jgi:fibronectin type 3 domain-containing protein
VYKRQLLAYEYEPGWYQDPDDASLTRYWDGQNWTEETRAAAPAGWYPDPEDPDMERYWNGADWTGVTQPAVVEDIYIPGQASSSTKTRNSRPAHEKRPKKRRGGLVLMVAVAAAVAIAVFGLPAMGSFPGYPGVLNQQPAAEPTSPTTPVEAPTEEPTPTEQPTEEPTVTPTEPTTPTEQPTETPTPTKPPTPPVTKPAVTIPGPLTVTSTGVHSTSLTWNKISGATYEIQRSTSSKFTAPVTLTSKTTSLKDADLPTGTTYYYRVRAVTKGKKSDWTNAKHVTLKGVASSAPESFGLTSNRRNIMLNWAAPTTTGSAPVTSYIIQRSTDKSFSNPTKIEVFALSYADNNLPAPAQYWYRIAALNGDRALSAWTAPATVTIPLLAPVAPSSVDAKMVKHDVQISWGAPSDDGGSAVTGYVVTRATNKAFTSGVKTFNASASPLLDTSVNDNVKYYYKVVALNSVGSSPAASVSISTPLIASPPSAPRSLSGVASAGNITVSWGAPSSNGGANVTGYTVQYSTSKSFSNPGTVTTTSKSYSFKKFPRGTNFYFRVSAKNAAGTSSWSAAAGPYVCPYTEASAPQSVSYTYNSSTRKYLITWKAPVDDGGRKIIFYYVQSSFSGTGSWVTSVTDGPVLSYTKSAGTNNYIRIVAVTSGGSSSGGTPSAVIHLK